MRRLRHPLKTTSRLVTIAWLWRNRHDLLRWIRFAARVPSEVQARGFNHLAAEARVRLALTADPRTRAAKDLDIAGLDDGTLVVCTPTDKPTAEVAREVLAGAPGVKELRVVDPPARATGSSASSSTAPSTSTATPSTTAATSSSTATADDSLATPEDDTFALGPAEARS
ncbi:MAG TPA: hypothetical protein VIL36_08340 [Acidimicrobiales bacterium]